MRFSAIFRGVRAWFVVLALGAASAGCVWGKPPAPPETDETFVADPTVPTAAFVEWVGAALSEVSLRPEQYRVLKARGNALMARHKPQMEARARLAELLARQLEEGNMAPAALDEARKNLAAAAEDVGQDDIAALVDLHETLDEAQRKAFTAAIRARLDKHPSDIYDLKTRYMLWRHDLHLSDEQQGRIFMSLGLDEATLRDLRAENDKRRAFLEGVLTAFEGPTFDPAVCKAGESPGTLSERRSGRLVQYLAAAAPVLTPDQRVRAANLLRTRTGQPSDEMLPGMRR
jgi:hypothetical protein